MYKINNSGWIEFLSGPMYSGKTDELLRRLNRARIADQSYLAFKPGIDDRYKKEEIVSHDGRTVECEVIQKERPENILSLVKEDTRIVVIDEVQFFDISVVEVIEDLADLGKRVIVAGLDLDFRGEPWEVSAELLSRAEYVDKLKGVCIKCGELATRTQREIEGVPAHYNSPLTLVGSEEAYKGVCRECHVVRYE